MNDQEEVFYSYEPPHKNLWAFLCIGLCLVFVYIIMSSFFLYFDTNEITRHIIRKEASKEAKQVYEPQM